MSYTAKARWEGGKLTNSILVIQVSSQACIGEYSSETSSLFGCSAHQGCRVSKQSFLFHYLQMTSMQVTQCKLSSTTNFFPMQVPVCHQRNWVSSAKKAWRPWCNLFHHFRLKGCSCIQMRMVLPVSAVANIQFTSSCCCASFIGIASFPPLG